MSPLEQLRKVLEQFADNQSLYNPTSSEVVSAEESWARYDRGLDVLTNHWPAMLAVIEAAARDGGASAQTEEAVDLLVEELRKEL